MIWMLSLLGTIATGGYLLLRGGVWLSRRYEDWSQGPITVDNWRARLKTMSSKIDQNECDQ